ncbi:glycosyltransferase [Shouchella lehensis]|uniref:Glycosyltransferase n=1 Tax=Shouchella lehensis TaxID=300825 RepID=A0A4Y7WLN5_9BACI|nr:glycosyltransferase [Shouchella lehensis]MBG9783147.1 hypothetical protein [Shouchella lehensis]TES49488.1 glycosyltransferase [Shouchella lehensis]
MKISIIIPNYNDGKIIRKTLCDIGEMMETTSYDYELIPVVDGSTDNSISEIMKASNVFPKIKLIHYQNNNGKGAAVTVGIAKATGDYIGFLDADNSTDLNSYLKIIEYAVKNKKDCVIGSRYKEYKGVSQPIVRKYAGYTYSYLLNCMFRIKVRDIQCGAKLFSKKSIGIILNNTHLKGFSFDIDYLTKLKKEDVEIDELQVSWKHYGTYDIRTNILLVFLIGLPMVKDVVKLKLNKMSEFNWEDVYYSRY